MELQAMRPDDWPAVHAIYEAGIATGNATFETTAPRLADLGRRPPGRPPAGGPPGRSGGGLDRPGPGLGPLRLCRVAEDSIYVALDAQGSGVGRALLAAVVT